MQMNEHAEFSCSNTYWTPNYQNKYSKEELPGIEAEYIFGHLSRTKQTDLGGERL